MRALLNPGFRILLLGQSVSILGTWIQGPAQRWLVLELTGSSFAVGLLGASAGLPLLLFSLFGGWITDRLPRIQVLLAANGVILFQALALGSLVQGGGIRLGDILVLAFLFGYSMAFEVPARQALIFDIVGRDAVTNAVAIHSMAFNAAQFIGPAIAGYLMESGLTAFCFYAKAASAAVVIGALVLLQRRGQFEQVQETGGSGKIRFLASLRETFAFVRAEPRVRTVLLVVTAFGVLLLPYAILLPSFCRDALGLGPREYGILSSANGLGAFSAATLVAIFGHKGNRDHWWWTGVFLFPLAILALSFAPGYYLAMLLLFATGFSMILTSTSAIGLIQISTHDALRGRLLGLFTMCFMGLFPVGSLTGGAVAAVIGIRPTLALMGGLGLAAVIGAGLLSRRSSCPVLKRD